MNPRYCITEPDRLILRALDSMTLIFHPASGITHIVAEPVPAIIEVMGAEKLHVVEIAERLAANFDIADDENLTDALASRLAELCELGLAERLAG